MFTASDKKSILERFQKERARDKMKIENLTQELLSLRKLEKNGGDLGSIVSIRKNAPKSSGVESKPKANRFHGIENLDQQVSH